MTKTFYRHYTPHVFKPGRVLESVGRAAKVLINIRRVRLASILTVASARFSPMI